MKFSGIVISSVMVEAGITISKNLGDLFPTYIANYKLLQKCSLFVWKNMLNKDGKNTDIIKENDSIDEVELDYILKNKEELE